MRKLALDVGSKSCGIAISDPLCIIAQGKENFMFDEYDFDTLNAHILKYLEEYEIDVIVVGRPTLPSGTATSTTKMIESYADSLRELVNKNISIIFIDENMSTKKAHEVMIAAGLSREKRKRYKDKLAAQIILQDYLARLV